MFINLLLLIVSLKCENWYSEVNGHKVDANNWFAGASKNNFTDFYLFSEKKYRA